MNKTTRAIDKEQYNLIISTIRNGFTHNGSEFKPNNRLATALVVQANLGIRISDIIKLTLSDIVFENGRYHLDIIEQKTGKYRNFTVPNGLYEYLVEYAKDNGITKYARLFPVCERALQKQLKIVADYLGLVGISTHSFRKFYATEMYINNDYDIELVRHLLQHSSAAVTQKYIGISSKRVENAINKHLCLA
jgi:integrase